MPAVPVSAGYLSAIIYVFMLLVYANALSFLWSAIVKRISLILILIGLSGLSSFSYSEELPVTSFSALPKYRSPTLSPDGKKLAFIQNYQEQGLSILSSFDFTTGEKKLLVKSDNEKIKLRWFEWANNKTLIISGRFASRRDRDDTVETRLMAIEADGSSEVRSLIRPPGAFSNKRTSQFQDNVIDFLPDEPNKIMVAVDLDTANMPSVYKLDIYTKRKERITKGKMQIRDYMTDQQGQLRLGEMLNYKTGEEQIYVRQVGSEKWESIHKHNALEEDGVDGITPKGFGLDPNILYYSTYKGDKKALYKMDIRTKTSELVFEDPNYDVTGGLIYSEKTRDVIGLYHANTSTGRVYWDKSRSKFQKAFDKALPDTDNYLISFNQDENNYILYTENDFTPGAYYYGDRKAGEMMLLFEQYPDLVPEVLTEHNLVSYKARDGIEIDGYLTLPKDAEGPVPTILHPHGGPWARDLSGFDYWTSYFTNRGYAVFRPNFRGSSGYGKAFAESQMQSWGMAMQDDLTDAAHWLVKEGIAQEDKMCIVGASYGGYAAAMAAVKTPDLFQCAVSFAGVMDLKLRISNRKRFLSYKFVKKQMGTDSDDLEARSPYYSADKIKIPLLLIHGEEDRVVDARHSKKMAAELEDLKKPVEYIELENGDHYLSIQRNRHAFFAAMDKFLKRHL